MQNKKALFLRGIFGGGGSGMTKQQPENNIVRGDRITLWQRPLSGAQTTALCSFDEAYTIPTERAALLSLRTFQILMDEIGLRDTVDPLAGSYFIETLTKEMEEKILEENGRKGGKGRGHGGSGFLAGMSKKRWPGRRTSSKRKLQEGAI